VPYFLRRHRFHGADLVRRRPLFPGYVFVRADLAADRSKILTTRGVVGLLGGRRPEAIPPDVIQNLQIAAAHPVTLTPAVWRAGELVTVAHGPLAGLTGVVERSKGGRRLIIRADFLMRACALEIGEAEIYRARAAA
jgi:transcription antitermination factor NusG